MAQGPNTEIITVPITVYGHTAQAHVIKPDDYATDMAKKYPLIVFSHGLGEKNSPISNLYNNPNSGPAYVNGIGKWPSKFTVNGEDFKFLVLSPQITSGWTNGTNLKYAIEDFVKRYRVDTSRIYVTGLSAGGDAITQYSAHLGAQNGSSIDLQYKAAAAVPMSEAGNYPSKETVKNIADDTVSLWGFGSVGEDSHGANTKILCDEINKLKPGLAKFTNYSGGHCCWQRFYDPTYKENEINIYEWMLGITKDGTVTPPVEPPTKKLLVTIKVYSDGSTEDTLA